MDKRPIGVFDSGIGGLTVVKEILRVLPEERIIYLGDTARVPWGTRSKKIIALFSQQAASFLVEKRVKIVVVACHTASSVALPDLRKRLKTPLLGVIESSAKAAIEASKSKRIGIMGTSATIRSGAWEMALRKEDPKVKVFSIAAPLLVSLVEEGWFNHPSTAMILKEYLSPLLKKKIDALILACTHYPLLVSLIKKVSPDLVLVNPGRTTALALRQFLKKENLQGKIKQPLHCFYFTDFSLQTKRNLERFADRLKNVKIKEVDLEK